MGRVPLISGNWKMNLNHFEAIQLLQKLSYELGSHNFDSVEVSVHPPFTNIRSIQTVIDADRMLFKLGAQNCHFEPSGAFTGEVSPAMLKKLDVDFVIVGHSERRGLFGEANEMVAAKASAVFSHGMVPIVCVGESLEERENGQAEVVVEAQIRESLAGLKRDEMSNVVVAYEPIWAIGTGATASPSDAQEMCSHIRSTLASMHAPAAEKVRIQYGGSVNASNVNELMSMPDVDGALVGGASLEAASFARIVGYEDA